MYTYIYYVISGRTACLESSVCMATTPPHPKRRICCGAFCPRGIATVTQHSHQTAQHLRLHVVGWGWLGIRYLYHWSSREKWGKNGVTRLGFRSFKPPVGKKTKTHQLSWHEHSSWDCGQRTTQAHLKRNCQDDQQLKWNWLKHLEISGDIWRCEA